MKKITYILILFLFTCLLAEAKNIKFLEQDYILKDIQKTSTGYINKYVKPSQNIENSTNIITVISALKEKSEFDFINNYINSFAETPNFNMIGFHPEINTLSYGVIYENNGLGYIEYSVLKYKSNENKGISAILFAHRYRFNGPEEFVKARENCYKFNNNYIQALLETEIPQIKK